MTIIDDAFKIFVEQLSGIGYFPLPPEVGSLGDKQPDLPNLTRDAGTNIITQGPEAGRDGGDSAHKTGLAAFCNSRIDCDALPQFEIQPGIMVRHPTQFPWNNWKNSSRDQLMAYTAGCWRARRFCINARLLKATVERVPPFTAQNTERDDPGTVKPIPIGDPLWPDDVMALRICAGDNAAYSDAVGQFALQTSIQLASKKITVENNALITKSIIGGRLDLFVQCHPRYRDAIRDYWNPRQPAIGEALIWMIDEELKRYRRRLYIPLLPQNILTLLLNLNLNDELQNFFSPLHQLELAGRFAEATLKDTANFLVTTLQWNVELTTNTLKEFGHAADQIANALEANGVSEQGITNAVQQAFPGWVEAPRPPRPPQRARRFPKILMASAGVLAGDVGIR